MEPMVFKREARFCVDPRDLPVKGSYPTIDQILSRPLPVCPISPTLICTVAIYRGRQGRKLFDDICFLIDEHAVVSNRPELKSSELFTLMGLFGKTSDAWSDVSNALEKKESTSSTYTVSWFTKREVDILFDFLFKLCEDIHLCSVMVRSS